MSRPIEIGDKVAYSADFLRDTVQQASPDDKGGWRGVVTAIDGGPDWRLCVVDWNDRQGRKIGQGRVLDKNLAREGSPQMYAR